jgi:malate dehydrogenase
MTKVSIIGSGNVGANSAFFIAENRSASVTLVDIREGLPKGKALDLSEAGPIRGYDTRILGAGSIEDIHGSDIVVIAAGRVRNAAETRNDLYRDNAVLMNKICEDIKRLAPDSVIINIVEPVDRITLLVQKLLAFDRKKVLGIGGLLTGIVVGPHLPCMVILRDTVRVSGIPAEKLLPKDSFEAIIHEVRRAGDTILRLAEKSTSFYAPSAAVAALVEAVARDTGAILPVSFRLQGEYGFNDIAVSVPASIGAGGVSHIVEIQMNASEKEELRKSVAELRASMEDAAEPVEGKGGKPRA